MGRPPIQSHRALQTICRNSTEPSIHPPTQSAQSDKSAVPRFHWARRDSNPLPIPQQKGPIQDIGAAKGASSGADSFAEAVAGIMRLPLSDTDKAEAVRRLLADAKARTPGE